MSHEDHIRRQIEDQARANPNIQKIEPYQAPDAWTANVVNDEIERQRRREEAERNSRR